MDAGTTPARATSLVIELAARTAIVDGKRVELPPVEFSLLAVLAARAGEVVSRKELLEEAFGDSAYMDAQDLHWRIWSIRKLIGDHDRSIVRNRRGVGFALDHSAVQVVEGVSPPSLEDEIPPVVVEPGDATAAEPQPAGSGGEVEPGWNAVAKAAPKADTGPRRRIVRPSVLIAALLISSLLLGGSWLAGYSLSTREREAARNEAAARDDPDSGDAVRRREARKKPTKSSRKAPDKPKRGERPKAVPPVASGSRQGPSGVLPDGDAGSTEGSSQPPTSGNQGGTDEPAREAPSKKPAPPSYPPAPTRYLYHLVNHQTGDHFVTIEASAASEHEAMGYEGGAIARVYSYEEEGTRAISTNQGTAYIFISATPRTEPASQVVTLWYSTNGDGDFFYSTSEAEATRRGWQGSVIGYGRSL
ncbi:MAG: winged helix-turn-helix domain-containing protein [Actinomycetota bacterium]|nr:winged helix-turn-helix domain-containing protein [Actinomycetota bacterium]